MALLESILGGGGTTQNNATTALLTPQDQAAKTQVFNAAQGAFKNAMDTQAQQGYTGPAAIGPSAQTTAAQTGMVQAANTQQQIANGVPAATQFGLADVLNVAGNQNLSNLKNLNMQSLMDAFSQAGGPLSQVRNSAVMNGGVGGSRQGIAEGLAMQGLSKNIALANAGFDNQAYGQGLNTFNQTLNSLPTAQAAVATPASTLGKVGANVEGYQQTAENAAAAQRDWNVNKDFAPAQQLANLIYGGMTPGTNSTATNSSTPSGAQQIGTLGQMAMMLMA